MRRALLIGTTGGPSLDEMEALLREIGGWCITRLEGEQTTRAEILAALARLEAAVDPRDAVLVHFVGHGGVVEIRDLPPPLGGRLVFYLAVHRIDGESPFQPVLDIELSTALARIDRVCENVTAVLDCCYSARIVRGPSWELHESPPWLRTLAEQLRECADDWHRISHPRIVRLAGSSSLGRSFSAGSLTRGLVEVVREAQLQIDRLTWDAVAHRVREQAIARLGCEEQWVTLAGPRQRLLFSRRAAPLPRTVGFVPDERGGGWIRAGALQGVNVDDEWRLARLTLDEHLRPRWSARMRVTAVELNRARLEPIGEVGEPIEYGASAHSCSATSRERVRVEGPERLREAVSGSPWLAEGDSEHLAELTQRGDALEVRRIDDRFAAAQFTPDEVGLAAAIERLEEWARASLLLEVVAACSRATQPITARLAGDRLELECISESESWFVNAILIDAAGCSMLLDPAEPDGREMLPRQRETIVLRWSDAVAPRPGPARVIVLACRRPIALGHLVGVGMPRGASRRRARTRGHLSHPRPRTGPELAWDWAAALLQVELAP